MSAPSLRDTLYDLRERAADDARDGPAGMTINARERLAYEWLGDNIDAFVTDREEQATQAAIDGAPEPLRRLGEWLSKKLDEDDWKTAERMLLGAVLSIAGCCDENERLRAERRGRLEKVDRIRALGWAVAVHNDYRLNGEAYTFWLFTKDGHAVKGEGRTDDEALTAVLVEITGDAQERRR